MRMPLSDFLANGDLKFVIILFLFLSIAIYYFVKKIINKEQQERLNLKMNKLVTWSIFMSAFSLMLGLLHSFYFISKVNGIANNLLFGGLANVIITPTLGIIIAMIIKLLSTPISSKK
ncbi:hypothetical protein BST83_01310 [Polaribacter filamentus]|jgi:uncharacterized protein YacL|uniref:MotA/TolQ/ExbB proton channel domain-containing protein n=2 Tax=Polaribacter filamentus TaxID=53483 RepID=A0A2S7L279_9FLAO|nr:hypothetical protein BST83_01310 [Polaribacter filamentus]